MGFLLKSITIGDDLIPPQTSTILFSKDREILENLISERKYEREEWVKNNPNFPEWAKAGIIDKDFIEEVPDI